MVKWWFPARYFGLRHKNTWFDTTFKGWTDDEIRAWKQAQANRQQMSEMTSQSGFVAQPRYEKVVRIGPMRYGLTVRLADGTTAVHELGRIGRPRFRP